MVRLKWKYVTQNSTENMKNKKAVQGNRGMPRSCSFWFKVRPQHTLQVSEYLSFESQASELQTHRRKTEF